MNLLLELFPTVARDFLTKQVEEAYLDNIYHIEEEKRTETAGSKGSL